MRHTVLVRHIRHLTDARYFAAMGVDWMSLELDADPISFSRWHTLRDWVEGVRLVAELDVRDDMLLARAIIDAAPDGVLAIPPMEVDLPEGVMHFLTPLNTAETVQDHAYIILPYDPALSADEQLRGHDPERVFLEADWTASLLRSLLVSGYTGGICLEGGEESETGMRDYEMMDGLFEELRGWGVSGE